MKIVGKNAAREILNSSNKIECIYLNENFNNSEILKLINKRHITPFYKSMSEMDKLSKEVHQGIIIEAEDYE